MAAGMSRKAGIGTKQGDDVGGQGDQVPFLDKLFQVGPLVKPLGGADISWIVGFGVASLLYLAGRSVSSGLVRVGRRPIRWLRKVYVA